MQSIYVAMVWLTRHALMWSVFTVTSFMYGRYMLLYTLVVLICCMSACKHVHTYIQTSIKSANLRRKVGCHVCIHSYVATSWTI